MKIEKTLLIILLIFAFSRILLLDADPPVFKYEIADIGDEGLWVHEARNKVLFNEWVSDDLVQGMATAPLYTILSFAIFKFLGVHLFTTRLISAITGILAIFLLYLIVRKYNKRLAVIAATTLALDNSFFVYNRIGHVETLVIFFLLLNFFFLTYRTKSRFYLLFAGACFMLAIISKITSLIFFIPMLIYLAASCLRKEINLKDVLVYSAGFLLVAIPFMLFYYIPIFPAFKSFLGNFVAVEFGKAGMIALAPLNTLIFITADFFLRPSIFLLTIMSLIYFKQRGILTFFANIRQNIKSLNEIELIAFSWFFGYAFALVFSDFGIRRFNLLIIPLVLFSSMLFDRRGEKKITGEKNINWFIFIILLIPILSLLNYPIISIAYSNYLNLKPILNLILPTTIFSIIEPLKDTTVTKLTLMGLSLLGGLISTGLYMIIKHKKRHKTLIEEYLPYVSLFALLLTLSLALLFYNDRIILDFLNINIPTILIISLALLLSILLFRGLIKRDFLLKRIILTIYIISCIIMITYILLFPSYSIKDSSKEISKYCDGEWVIGHLEHVLSLENKMRPLFWTPNLRTIEHLNQDVMEKYKPKCYLWLKEWEGKEPGVWVWPEPADVNETLIYLDTFELWPIFGKPRAIIELYNVDYIA